jgi:hypothetical protein
MGFNARMRPRINARVAAICGDPGVFMSRTLGNFYTDIVLIEETAEILDGGMTVEQAPSAQIPVDNIPYPVRGDMLSLLSGLGVLYPANSRFPDNSLYPGSGRASGWIVDRANEVEGMYIIELKAA